jgi:hypothetical protein
MGVISLGSSASGTPGGSSIISLCTDGLDPHASTDSFDSVYSHHIATFTNGAGYTQTVREVLLDGYFRVVLDENDLPNFCQVPQGASITVDYYFTLASYPPEFADVAVALSMDTGGFTNAAPIHYNGHPITNGQIVAQTDNSWDIKGYTEAYSEISALNAFVGPVSTGQSILGKKYVVSAFRSGTLFIQDLITRAKTSYSNCYVTDMKIEPFYLSSGRLGWYFTVSITKSAYAEIL